MTSLEVIQRLAEVQRQIEGLPKDAFLERIGLQDRQNELRAQAARIRQSADTTGSDGELLDRLANLRRQRDDIEKSQIDVVKQAGKLTAGLSGTTHQGDATRLNRQIRDGRGLPQIEQQIAQIKRTLLDHGVDPG